MSTLTSVDAREEDAAQAQGGRTRRTTLLLGLVVLALLAGAAWWFLLRPGGDAAPEPGEIVPLDSTQINLAGGHYLKVGVALQLTADAEAEVDGSKALDATIDLFSGKRLQDLSAPKQRRHLKARLARTLEKRYDGDVMGVYLTEFVTQ